MKKLTKVLAAASMLLLLSASLYADPPKKAPDASLSVVEALQNSFRSISNTMLPAVVEVDVTETKTYTDPFGGMSNPFEFFFGSPRGKNNEDDTLYEYCEESKLPGITHGTAYRKCEVRIKSEAGRKCKRKGV